MQNLHLRILLFTLCFELCPTEQVFCSVVVFGVARAPPDRGMKIRIIAKIESQESIVACSLIERATCTVQLASGRFRLSVLGTRSRGQVFYFFKNSFIFVTH